MVEAEFVRRSLASAQTDGLRVLDALRWPTPLGHGLRIYFGRGTTAEDLKAARGAGVQLQQAVMAGPNLIAMGATDVAEGPLRLTLPGGAVELQPTVPETALFDDLNTLLALRHRETAAAVRDWLAYHVVAHGLEAVVIVDRGPPGKECEAFAAALQGAVDGLPGLKRLLLVDAPLPLGLPDQPALGDPGAALRAKTAGAGADPWRAPLAEPVLYDILKWRFLTRAGAVVTLDPCDLLALSGDGIGVFDAIRQSHTGLLPLTGQGIFPWRVRKQHLAAHADHICRADPPVSLPVRWGVAPKRCAPEHLWLQGRVVGLGGLADETGAYHRCMAVLFPDSDVAELVDKSELVEDAALLERATGALGGNPVRAPERAAPALVVAEAMPSGRTAIVTCMKNEGPFILEWLAFHRMIGVDDFLIYTNDCDDGTDTMLDLLQSRGLVKRRDNPFRATGQRPQHAALDAAQGEEVIRQAGWVICMDVDEYLNIHAGKGRLRDLYVAVGDANLVSITWRLFGNSDIDHFEDRFVTEQFTRCAPHLIRRPHQAWGFKTLFRNQGLFDGFGVHRPKGLRRGAAGQVKWVNGSGRPMPGAILKTGWRSGIDSYGYDLVTLNHYSVRNVESYLVKRDRGRVNHVSRDQGEAYWFRMNNNAEEDRSIQRHGAALRAAYDDLLRDPAIAEAHAVSVAAHRQRISDLLAQPDYRALYDSLSSERMKKLSRMHRNFGMNVFLNGPGVIPDKVFDPSLPETFFYNTAPPAGKAAD